MNWVRHGSSTTFETGVRFKKGLWLFKRWKGQIQYHHLVRRRLTKQHQMIQPQKGNTSQSFFLQDMEHLPPTLNYQQDTCVHLDLQAHIHRRYLVGYWPFTVVLLWEYTWQNFFHDFIKQNPHSVLRRRTNKFCYIDFSFPGFEYWKTCIHIPIRTMFTKWSASNFSL